MEPVRSSLVGGVVATITVAALLFVVDLLLGGTDTIVLATFSSACLVGGPPFCEVGSTTATVVNLVVFAALFAVAWPLLFAGFTWGLPGESGIAHGAVFGLVLWTGYLVVVWATIARGWEPVTTELPTLAILAAGYLLYGVILGGTYDYFAEHRTLLVLEDDVEPAA